MYAIEAEGLVERSGATTGLDGVDLAVRPATVLGGLGALAGRRAGPDVGHPAGVPARRNQPRTVVHRLGRRPQMCPRAFCRVAVGGNVASRHPPPWRVDPEGTTL